MMTKLGMRSCLWALSSTPLLALAAACGGGDDPASMPLEWGMQVDTEDGTLEGAVEGGTRSFLGIPYAKPPVDELRWMPPEPPEPWDGVRDATEFGGRCAQLESTTLMNAASDTEDCLYLNVWTPEERPEEPLPVMFWIHGGGNRNGSASEPVPFAGEGLFYSGQDLAANHDVVVVTLNYRLGVFGFMAHPDLATDDTTAGNQGLRDQRMAMQWVQDHIARFGGDPDNVTIFGESAGSFDVCMHVASPESRGLFHRAISQSGGCTTLQPTQNEAEATAEELVAAVGCDEADDALQCLRDTSVSDLLDAAANDVSGDRSFGPHVDGEFLPDQPRALYDSGDIADVPYILGSTTDEGSLFLFQQPIETEEAYMAALENAFPDAAELVAEQYPISDFEDAMPNPEKAAVVRAIGDGRLVCTTYDTAARAQESGLPVYTYNFDIPVPIEVPGDYLGATHGGELTYVFGTSPSFTEEEEEVSNLMQRYWSRFAATGDPNGGDDVQWPMWSLEDNQRMNFSLDPSVVTDFRADECEFWRTLYDAQFE